jgi:glycosyltransferase involved in cell wall biosynthesis
MGDGAGPLISVVIATYNRAETLKITLSKIAAQTIGAENIEVVISDDGSPDNTPEIVREVQAKSPMSIIYDRHENHGVGYTQNRGIELASGKLMLLIADDIWLEPDALEQHIAGHRQRPQEEVALLGRVYQSPILNQSAFLRTWDPFQFRALKDGTELPYYMFWACHISCKTEFMRKHGMFKEDLARATYAAHEDAEVGYRLYTSGNLRIFHLAAAKAYHYHITTLESELKRSYGRGINYHVLKTVVPEPEITVRYHALTLRTVKEHVRAVFGERARFLMASERNPFKLLIQHAARAVLFNFLTVKGFWLKVFALAERHRWVERLLNYHCYRGVIYYYFLEGVREGETTDTNSYSVGSPAQ